jgi:hypothetical protein
MIAQSGIAPEMGCEDGRWMELAQDRVQWRYLALAVLNLRVLLPDSLVIWLPLNNADSISLLHGLLGRSLQSHSSKRSKWEVNMS